MIQFATETQAKHLEAIKKYGSQRKAAKALGISRSTIDKSVRRVHEKAALAGFSPEHDMTHPVPDPFYVKGVSSLYDGSGQLKAQWVKTNLDKERHFEIMKEAIEGLADEVRGLAPLTEAPSVSNHQLLAVYPMGDAHFGLKAHAAEAGDNFDLNIAERLTLDAVDRLVSSAPPADVGLFINLGDFFHTNDNTNKTPASGNLLDVDGRFAKVVQVGLRAMIHCIRRMLEKHKRVIVWNMIGNHDPEAALWLSVCLDAFFTNEPRVTIDLSPSLYKFYRFGKVLIGSHHGHGAKPNELPLLMASDRPEDWGQTQFRHWLCGHIHHWTAKEHPGAIVETFGTLAAKDAWHAGKGYRSRRDMSCIVFHRNYGEIQRIRCDVSMVQ